MDKYYVFPDGDVIHEEDYNSMEYAYRGDDYLEVYASDPDAAYDLWKMKGMENV